MKNKVENYEYNIYRVPVDNVPLLVDHLEKRNFEELPFKEGVFGSLTIARLFFCDKENRRGLPWISMLDQYCEDSLEQDAKVYGAVILFCTDDFCFAVSYGNAHFYMSRYCDHSFGICIAERLIDLDKVNSQQNISYGTRLNKSHMDFRRPLRLVCNSGDFPSFIQGDCIEPNVWGLKIVCGTSVQFKWPEALPELPDKLCLLNQIINRNSTRQVAQMLELSQIEDSEIIAVLNEELISNLHSYRDDKTKGTINIPSFYLVGTRLMQSSAETYRLTCDRKAKMIHGGISLGDIIGFWDEHNFDYTFAFEKTSLSTDSIKYQPIMNFVEYVTDINGANYCLINGAWHTFNKEYIRNVHDRVDRIPYTNHKNDELKYSRKEILEKAGISSDILKVDCETYYNKNLSKLLGLTCLHPHTTEFEDGNSIKIELCDLYKDTTLYFVKIGDSGKFAEAADQALLTLDRVIKDNGKLRINESIVITPSEIRLVLIYTADKKRQIHRISDIRSLKFLVHLTELDDLARQAGINVHLDFVYEELEDERTEKIAS